MDVLCACPLADESIIGHPGFSITVHIASTAFYKYSTGQKQVKAFSHETFRLQTEKLFDYAWEISRRIQLLVDAEVRNVFGTFLLLDLRLLVCKGSNWIFFSYPKVENVSKEENP